jgi:prolipoprotein diacylglyceryltransferase
VAEWLGRGLQNLVQRFESALHLQIPRKPLYEQGFFVFWRTAGIVLFVILWTTRKKAPWTGFLTGLYLIGYGTVRFFIEFFREPDAQLGFVFFNFSMGQVLCF